MHQIDYPRSHYKYYFLNYLDLRDNKIRGSNLEFLRKYLLPFHFYKRLKHK